MIRMTCITLITLFVTTGTAFAQEQQAEEADSAKTITVDVTGITCGNDLNIINDNLKEETGVIKSEALGNASAKTSFEITYDPGKITRKQIVKVVEGSPSCDRPELKPYRVKN